MAAIINELIDKQDTNEIVRNKIAIILFEEKENQKLLAIAEGKDPNEWDFSLFVERARAWEINKMPLINVSYDNDTFDNKGSTNSPFQNTRGIFYLDCYASIDKTETLSGDEATSKESEKIARLARNIIMYEQYQRLQLDGLVQLRYIVKREKFQPDIQQEGYSNIVVTRLTLQVQYQEFALQEIPTDLEIVSGDVTISETGEVLFNVEFDYT